MKIGVNLITLYPGKIGGAEQYIRNILKEFEYYEDTEFYVFLNESGYKTFTETSNTHLINIKITPDTSIEIKAYIEYYCIEVLFCPLLYLDPLDCEVPSVTTIFDIQQYYFPEYFEEKLLEMRINLTRETVQKSNKIIAVSEFSKNTILENHIVDSEKISITYLNSDNSFYLPIESMKLAEMKNKLPAEYVLFPANMWPHKNHICLLKAITILKDKYNLNMNVVFTGTKDKEAEKISEFIKHNNLEDNITYLGYVEQDDMRYIFRLANMLVFPSLFEGFPLPIVEAMRSDLPIVCSNTTCLPEMAGDAAVLVDPKNPDEIAKAMYSVYTDKDLRNILIKNGRKISKDYSWKRCASETMEVLKSVYVKREHIANSEYLDSLISIIIPVCDFKSNYSETINSILKQNYKNYEVIVIGEVFTYCNNTENIKYIFISPSNNRAQLINAALDQAKGKIIGIVESGDILKPDALNVIKECFVNHNVDLVYSKAENEKNDILKFDLNLFLINCYINRPSYFFTKNFFNTYGMFNEKYLRYESYDFWIKTARNGKLMLIPEILATLPSNVNKTIEDIEEILTILKDNEIEIPTGWKSIYCSLILRNGFKLSLFRKAFKFNCLGCLLKDTIKYLSFNPINPLESSGNASEGMWYIDGWISTKFSHTLELSGNETQILICGRNIFKFKNLKITILLDDTKHEFIINQTDFELKIPLDSTKHETVNITIMCNKWLVPSKKTGSSDNRKLSVLLEKLEAVE